MLYESIKNKNFLNIFNSIDSEEKIDQLLSELRRIPSDMFTSYEHYQYYKRYIVPKVKLVNKEYPWRSKVSPYKVYKFNHELLLCVCDTYLIMNFITYVHNKRKDRNNSVYRLLNRNEHVFILGFDTNGKLFVNEIPNGVIAIIPLERKEFREKGVYVHLANENDIRRRLGFEMDLAKYETITINARGNYRVQGEIVLDVSRELSSEEQFFESMVDRREIANYVEVYLSNYLNLALIDLGFSIEPSRHIRLRNVVSSNIINNPSKIMNMLKSLGDAIINELGKYIEINYVNYREKKDTDTDIYAIEYKIESNIALFGLKLSFIYFMPRPFRLPYSDIDIELGIDLPNRYEYCIMCKEIEKEFIDTLRSTPRQTLKMLLGNHMIVMKNVYVGNISFRPSKRLEIELVRLPSITNDIGFYYVDQESEIVVTHKEHGNTIIRFSKPFLVNFNTTAVLSNYPDKLNRIVLKNIVDGFHNNRKIIEFLDS